MFHEALVREAIEAKREIAKAQRTFDKVWKDDKKLGKSREISVIQAARAVLSSYGLGAALQDPSEWMQQVRDYLPEVYAEMEPLVREAQASAKPWTSMSLDDFRDLHELIVSLWEQSKSVREVELEGQAMAIKEVAQQAAAAIADKVKPMPKGQPTRLETTGHKLRDYVANARRVEHLFDELGGVFPQLFRRVATAADVARDETRKELELREELLKNHDFGPAFKIAAPELGGYEFGRGVGGHGKLELLGALQHAGNHSNLYKLLIGRREQGWAPGYDPAVGDTTQAVANWWAFVQRMIDEGHLTVADFEFLQKRWDNNERLKPGAQRTHKKLYGYFFREVPASSFTVRINGKEHTFAGGYVPAKRDKLLVQQAGIQDLDAKAEFYKSMPAVPKGFTQARLEDYARPLSLNLYDEVAHVGEVLQFTHLQPAVRDVQRVLNHNELRPVLERFNFSLKQHTLDPWLKRAAFQATSMPSEGVWENTIQYLSSSANAAIMFGNVANAVIGVTGLFVAGTKLPMTKLAGGFMRASVDFIRNPRQFGKDVAEASTAMRNRLGKQVFEISANMRKDLTRPGPFRKLTDFANRHTYVLQTMIQNVVDIAIWRTGYSHHIANGKTERQAVLEADAAVRQTQMAGNAEDISSWEFGGALKRAIFPFQSWFINWGNVNLTEFKKGAQRENASKRLASYASTYMLGIMLPMVLAELGMQMIRGQVDDEDGDYLPDDPLGLIMRAHLGGLGAVPVFGQFGQLAGNVFGDDEQWNNRMPAAPWKQFVERGVNAFGDVADGKASDRDYYDAVTLVGIAIKLPQISAIGKRIKTAVEIGSGEVEPTGPVDMVRALITGRPAR
jgi:hypothetical protein